MIRSLFKASPKEPISETDSPVQISPLKPHNYYPAATCMKKTCGVTRKFRNEYIKPQDPQYIPHITEEENGNTIPKGDYALYNSRAHPMNRRFKDELHTLLAIDASVEEITDAGYDIAEFEEYFRKTRWVYCEPECELDSFMNRPIWERKGRLLYPKTNIYSMTPRLEALLYDGDGTDAIEEHGYIFPDDVIELLKGERPVPRLQRQVVPFINGQPPQVPPLQLTPIRRRGEPGNPYDVLIERSVNFRRNH